MPIFLVLCLKEDVLHKSHHLRRETTDWCLLIPVVCFSFAHFKFSNLKTVKSFVWTSSKFYQTWKMVLPVVPVVTELLRNDERLFFHSASKLQKCSEGGQSINWNIENFVWSTLVLVVSVQ